MLPTAMTNGTEKKPSDDRRGAKQEPEEFTLDDEYHEWLQAQSTGVIGRSKARAALLREWKRRKDAGQISPEDFEEDLRELHKPDDED